MDEATIRARLRATLAELPRVLPAAWRPDGRYAPGDLVVARFVRRDGLGVLASVDESSGARWLHLSLSRADRLPSWDDVKDVKDTFLGPDVLAVQVLPPADAYVNAHPFCLHLWRRLDGPTLGGLPSDDAWPG